MGSEEYAENFEKHCNSVFKATCSSLSTIADKYLCLAKDLLFIEECNNSINESSQENDDHNSSSVYGDFVPTSTEVYAVADKDSVSENNFDIEDTIDGGSTSIPVNTLDDINLYKHKKVCNSDSDNDNDKNSKKLINLTEKSKKKIYNKEHRMRLRKRNNHWENKRHKNFTNHLEESFTIKEKSICKPGSSLSVSFKSKVQQSFLNTPKQKSKIPVSLCSLEPETSIANLDDDNSKVGGKIYKAMSEKRKDHDSRFLELNADNSSIGTNNSVDKFGADTLRRKIDEKYNGDPSSNTVFKSPNKEMVQHKNTLSSFSISDVSSSDHLSGNGSPIKKTANFRVLNDFDLNKIKFSHNIINSTSIVKNSLKSNGICAETKLTDFQGNSRICSTQKNVNKKDSFPTEPDLVSKYIQRKYNRKDGTSEKCLALFEDLTIRVCNFSNKAIFHKSIENSNKYLSEVALKETINERPSTIDTKVEQSDIFSLLKALKLSKNIKLPRNGPNIYIEKGNFISTHLESEPAIKSSLLEHEKYDKFGNIENPRIEYQSSVGDIVYKNKQINIESKEDKIVKNQNMLSIKNLNKYETSVHIQDQNSDKIIQCNENQNHLVNKSSNVEPLSSSNNDSFIFTKTTLNTNGNNNETYSDEAVNNKNKSLDKKENSHVQFMSLFSVDMDTNEYQNITCESEFEHISDIAADGPVSFSCFKKLKNSFKNKINNSTADINGNIEFDIESSRANLNFQSVINQRYNQFTLLKDKSHTGEREPALKPLIKLREMLSKSHLSKVS